MPSRSSPSPWAIAGALLAVYVVCGSTYLAIRYAVDTLPPYMSASARLLIAGDPLYGVVRWTGAARPTAAQWRSTTLVGTLLLVGGNGAVVWAEQAVPSGLVFFFSSRRRHTRCSRDWSSDVCSSDLQPREDPTRVDPAETDAAATAQRPGEACRNAADIRRRARSCCGCLALAPLGGPGSRSEERRVGKECRSRGPS